MSARKAEKNIYMENIYEEKLAVESNYHHFHTWTHTQSVVQFKGNLELAKNAFF